MDRCFKCNEVLVSEKNKIVAICCDCKNSFHPECTRIGSSENYRKLGTSRKVSWKCDDCKVECSSNVSGASKCDADSSQKLFEKLENMQRDLSTQIQEVNGNVIDCKNQLLEVRVMAEENKSAICKLESENELRKQQCNQLKQENDTLKLELNTVKEQVFELEQYSRRNNLEIAGIPFTARENLFDVLAGIAEYINVAFHPTDISVVHRLPQDRQKMYHPKIIVRFISRMTKDGWRQAAKGKQLFCNELNQSLPATRFYLNEHLSLFNKEILATARKYVKQHKLAVAWTNDCKVLVKKTINGVAIRVRTVSDVENVAKSKRRPSNTPDHTAAFNNPSENIDPDHSPARITARDNITAKTITQDHHTDKNTAPRAPAASQQTNTAAPSTAATSHNLKGTTFATAVKEIPRAS